jgi:hypothetical protein
MAEEPEAATEAATEAEAELTPLPKPIVARSIATAATTRQMHNERRVVNRREWRPGRA